MHSDPASLALLIASRDEPGALYRVAEVIYKHGANITYIATSDVGETQIELESIADGEGLVADLQALEWEATSPARFARSRRPGSSSSAPAWRVRLWMLRTSWSATPSRRG